MEQMQPTIPNQARTHHSVIIPIIQVQSSQPGGNLIYVIMLIMVLGVFMTCESSVKMDQVKNTKLNLIARW